MTEVFEHNPSDHEDPRAGITWFIGAVGAMMLAVTMLAVWALYYNVKAVEVEAVVIIPIREDVVELQRRQEALLAGSPRWIQVVDEQGQPVRKYVIPVERAMEIIVQEANDGRWRTRDE